MTSEKLPQSVRSLGRHDQLGLLLGPTRSVRPRASAIGRRGSSRGRCSPSLAVDNARSRPSRAPALARGALWGVQRRPRGCGRRRTSPRSSGRAADGRRPDAVEGSAGAADPRGAPLVEVAARPPGVSCGVGPRGRSRRGAEGRRPPPLRPHLFEKGSTIPGLGDSCGAPDITTRSVNPSSGVYPPKTFSTAKPQAENWLAKRCSSAVLWTQP